MKFSEAISILEMQDGSTEVDEGLVSAYRKAMRKFHPDVTELDIDFALEMSKLVNEAYSFLVQNIGKWSVGDKATTNITGLMAEIYGSIKHIPHITIERVGVWLWVTIDGPPEFQDAPTDTVNSRLQKRKDLKTFRQGISPSLSAQGFRYGSGKQKWSWHDVGDGPRWKKKGLPWHIIKSRYGSEELETESLRAVG